MNRSQRALVALAIVFCGLAGAVFWSWRQSIPRTEKVLPTLGLLPTFHLIDQDGRPVTTGSLQRQISVWQLVYSQCETVCPLLLSRFAELDQNFRRSTRLQLLSVTTDPAIDQPPALAKLRQRYEGSSHWLFVTGELPEIARVVAGAFGADADSRGEELRRAATDQPTFILVDEDGRIRQRYPALDDDVVATVLEDVGTLLRAGQRLTK